jgi:hypothetical protein
VRVFFEFSSCHSIEQLVQINALGPLYPLPSRVDSRVSAYGADHVCCVDLDFAGAFNDLLQGSTDIPLTLWEES